MSTSLVNNSIHDSSKTAPMSAMHNFNSSVVEFKRNRSDKLSTSISRHLQLILTCASDASIFNPNTTVTAQFFANIYELFTIPETNASMQWTCVNLLHYAIKNRAAHFQMAHMYQFVPYLSQLLGDHLSVDKKVRVLTVIQDLTCGVKLNMMTPHLQHLLTTTLKWLNNKETDLVVMLSLGILVNLCFKNMPVQFNLAKHVKIKDLSSHLLTLTEQKVSNIAAKLFIVLNETEHVSDISSFSHLVDIVLRSIKDAYCAREHLALRQHVMFFLGFESADLRSVVGKHCPTYKTLVVDILKKMSEMQEEQLTDAEAMVFIECNSLLLRLLGYIVAGELPGVHAHYAAIVRFALECIKQDASSSDAPSLLQSIVTAPTFAFVDVEQRAAVTDMLVPAVCAFATSLQHADCPPHVAFFDLLKHYLRDTTTRDLVLSHTAVEHFTALFHSLPGDAVEVYVSALSVIGVASQFSAAWKRYLQQLFELEQTTIALAQALMTGTRALRASVLEVLACSHVSIDAVAIASAMQKFDSTASGGEHASMEMSFDACSKLHEVLGALRAVKACGQVAVDVYDVMEVYEQRIAISEQAAEAASACTARLLSQLAQKQTLAHRTRQLHLRAEQALKEVRKRQEAQLADEKRLRAQMQQAAQADAARFGEEVRVLRTRQAELIEERDALSTANANFSTNVIPQLQDSLKKMKKITERQEDTIKSLEAKLHAAETRDADTMLVLGNTQKALQERTDELERITKLAEERGALLETITKLMKQN